MELVFDELLDLELVFEEFFELLEEVVLEVEALLLVVLPLVVLLTFADALEDVVFETVDELLLSDLEVVFELFAVTASVSFLLVTFSVVLVSTTLSDLDDELPPLVFELSEPHEAINAAAKIPIVIVEINFFIFI